MSLGGKRVVVIGGGSGIGFAVAELAREAGADVVIASSRAATVDAAIERLSGSTGRVVDLRDEAGVAAFFQDLGPFDHLAMTAGDWGGEMFAATADIDLTQARDGLTVRFWGALAAAKHSCRTIAQDGSITLTSGMLGHRPMKNAPLVTAVAGAMEHLTRGLAVDLAPVRVNAVCPGLILTEHVKQTMPAAMQQSFVAKLPVPRAGSPEEVAMAYVYLPGAESRSLASPLIKRHFRCLRSSQIPTGIPSRGFDGRVSFPPIWHPAYLRYCRKAKLPPLKRRLGRDERGLAKVGVEGSNPFARSRFSRVLTIA
ncbi:SDR family oxidoreductase [Rhodopila sp.]|uniref:SDR family oxidoreductase n=1 Tax=Rhodopila sp. TaxID=2480087 RepID=UPI003D14D500